MTSQDYHFNDPITFDVSGLYFVEVVTPEARMPGGTPVYSVSYPACETPNVITELMPRRYQSSLTNRYPYMTATTNMTPLIFGLAKDGSDIGEARRFAENVGSSLNVMLRGTPATLTLSLYKSDRQADGVGLGLNAIRVDPEALFWPSIEQPRNMRFYTGENA